MADGRKTLPSVDWEREFETVALRRREAAENFASGGPAAAAVCGDLADRLREAGRLGEAEALYREALGLWRKLALSRRAVWLPLLAEACGDLADLLSETGQTEEALSLSREAVDLWRELERTDADCRPDLAGSCGALADLLSDTGKVDEAEELAREALDLWRKTAREDSGWEAELADACRSLADLLASGGTESGVLSVRPSGGTAWKVSREKEAEVLYCEALDLYRALSKRSPRYGTDAVLVCNNLGTLLCGQGRREAGEWFYRQALDLHRKQMDRTESAPFAASACGNLAGSLEERRPVEAERLYRAALDTWRNLGEGEKYLRETADACFRLASFLFNVRGDGDGAERLMREAVSLLRREARYAEAAAHIRRVMAEWGLADPIIELPAVLPAAAMVTELSDGEALAEPDGTAQPREAAQPEGGVKSTDRPRPVQKRARGRRTARPAPKGRHCIGRRDRDGEQIPKRWARPKQR